MTAGGIDHDRLVRDALALHRNGQLSHAEGIYRGILSRDPDHVDALNCLGLLCVQTGRALEAESLLRKALALDPNFSAVHNHLGGALQQQGRMDQAIACYRRAVELDAQNLAAYTNLADALRLTGQFDEAIGWLSAPLKARFPQAAQVIGNIGVQLAQANRYSQAAECFRRAIDAAPDSVDAHRNLGEVLHGMGHLDDSLAAYRKALQLDPKRADVHSAMLFTMLAHPDLGDETIYREHRQFDTVHGALIASTIRGHGNDRSPGRRLRVGYVSPDLREHAIAFFLEPLLANHDRKEFEVVCYQCVAYQDEVTARLKSHGHGWRELHDKTDEQAAEMIRADGIDILVDLSMHSPNNRFLVFARKPAPVQASYLAYAGSSGLGAMDWRVTDAIVDPPGMTESFHSEELLRLPRSFWCYRAPEQAPRVTEPPARKATHVTFGSANALAKINGRVLETWGEILGAVPGSRLSFKARGCEDPAVCRELAEALGRHGVEASRLDFQGWTDLRGYLEFFGRIDIALDSFPFAGGTTTCHALWMGVPVITLAGPTAHRPASRVGASILSNLKLPELIAEDEEEYVRIACELARDQDRLAGLRAGMRQRMSDSPLCDEAGITRELEIGYRQIWKRWCANG